MLTIWEEQQWWKPPAPCRGGHTNYQLNGWDRKSNRPTFTHKSLAYEAPKHVRTMMTIRGLVKCLFGKEMAMSLALLQR